MTQQAQENQKNINQLSKLIEKVQIAMLTTQQADGTLRSRPMSTQQAPFDGTLWFITDKETAKTEEIRQHHAVGISYADPGRQTYVSVSGTAQVVTDREKVREFWHEGHKIWFPDGPEDPNVVLLRVDVDQAEYWESNRLVTLVGFAKAYLTGESYQGEGAEHERLSLSGKR